MSTSDKDMSKITLIYFAGPGRAEVARLALHAGGVAFEDKKLSFEEFGGLKFNKEKRGPGQMFGSLPVLLHGDFQLAQSQAISLYAASLGLTPNLSHKERAIDQMYLGVHADMQTAMYKCLFGTDESKAAGKKALPKRMQDLLSAVESKLPKSGFILGGKGPSVGDLALFDACSSAFPGVVKLGIDLKPYPKLNALIASVKMFAPLKAYLDKRGF